MNDICENLHHVFEDLVVSLLDQFPFEHEGLVASFIAQTQELLEWPIVLVVQASFGLGVLDVMVIWQLDADMTPGGGQPVGRERPHPKAIVIGAQDFGTIDD